MDKREISRREFVRRSTQAGIVLAASPYFLHAHAAGAAMQSVAASDRVRFGMIGIGMRGSGILDTCVRLPGVECVAACDLYDDRHTLANEIIGKATGKTVPTTRTYQDLLDNKEIDCVVAAVPDHWHRKIVVDACDAGKDIYCEKPMTHEVEEGFRIIEAAQKNKRIVQIGSQRRSSITFAKARELIRQGAIGDVHYVQAILGRNSPCGAWVYAPPFNLSPQNLDWQTWLGDAPRRPFDPVRFARWRAFKDYGEGMPGDLFVHSLTGVHYVMGLDAPPERALSMGGLFHWKDGREFPDVMTTLYEYPNLRVAVLMTQCTDQEEITRFLGTRGVIEIQEEGALMTVAPQDGKDDAPCYYETGYPQKMRDAYEKKWHEENDPKPGATQPAEGTETYVFPPNYDPVGDHLWNFFQSVRTRQPSVEDAVFGNHTSIACHMANYSYFHRSAAVWQASRQRITA
ncbi:MAG TPA: Gfo/Idh/MocA family oxidoreductase [Steroidobacteraceae bacterium]|nr:Gfo/Idh/MocA family oxidoreductase [Steroidobacteraceae bacterium]